jgi:hypothetical protein
VSPITQVAALSVLALVLIGIGVWIVARVVKSTPEKKERKRRLAVNMNGRLGDALISEASDTTLYYSYSIHGVRYTTSQDVSTLRERLPADPGRLVGVANLKYTVRNPANSILLCEEWSGLRVHGTGIASDATTSQHSTSLRSQTASDA